MFPRSSYEAYITSRNKVDYPKRMNLLWELEREISAHLATPRPKQLLNLISATGEKLQASGLTGGDVVAIAEALDHLKQGCLDPLLARIRSALKGAHGRGGLDQSMFLDVKDLGPGVCKGICYNWIRRRLFRGKGHFAASAKPTPKPIDERLAKQGPLVQRVHGVVERSDDVEGAVGRLVKKAMCDSRLAKFRCFSSLNVGCVAPPVGVTIDPSRLARSQEKTAKRFCSGMIDSCLRPGNKHLIRPPSLWQTETEKEILRDGKQLKQDYTNGCFLIDLMAGTSGHSIIIFIDRTFGTIQYMDPNVGEFVYDLDTGQDALAELMGIVWLYYWYAEDKLYDEYYIDYFGNNGGDLEPFKP
ncbi:hypothetical protein J0H58_29575 [bacterium]|nr:hypothetical protein [bacterium]